jgi:GNAT superfamily N-acetyltransferase
MAPENNATIRSGTVADYPRARAVMADQFAFHQQALPAVFRETDDPPPTLATIERLLQDGAGAWFLAEAAGQVIGFLIIQLHSPAQEPYVVQETRAVVQDVGILSAWRGQGIGRALMEAAEQWARRQGARHLQLNVWEFNTGALRFYETMGFTTISRKMEKAL